MAGVRDNTVSNVVSGGIASFKSVGQVPLKSLKVNFSPIQEGDGDPSPSNIRAISGWTGLNVNKGSKNFLTDTVVYVSTVRKTEMEYTVQNNSATIDRKANVSAFILIKALDNITSDMVGMQFVYTASNYNTNDAIVSCNSTGNNRRTVTNGIITSEDVGKILTVRFYAGGEIKTYTATNMQLSLNSTSTTYEPYNGTTIPVSWSDLGTVYGGYVDLISGEVWKTFILKTLTGLESYKWKAYSTQSIYTNSDVLPGVYKPSNSSSIVGYCSHVSTLTNGRINTNYLVRASAPTETLQFNYIFDYWGLPEQTEDALNTFLQSEYNAGHPVQICYKLAEPLLIGTISPITIKSLIGVNNIWSNADTVEAQYCALESLDIYKQRFKTNEPHLQSASGNVVSFQTDMVAPLKECKVYFEPWQFGSGDPSPTNVRPVYGWSNINTTISKKNLFHLIGYSAINVNSINGTRKLTNTYGTTLSTTQSDNSVTITQEQQPETTTTFSYKNGYFIVIDDNLQFGQKYNFSFKITDIINNPLNTTLDNIRLNTPGGGQHAANTIDNNTLIFKNILYDRYKSTTAGIERHGLEIRNCGMSFTLSDFMATKVDEQDMIYEPFKGFVTNITLPSTFYGGYVDLTSGEGVQTFGYTDDLGAYTYVYDDDDVAPGTFRLYLTSNNFRGIKYMGKLFCSSYKGVEKGYRGYLEYNDISVTNSQANPILRIRDENFIGKTPEEIKTLMSGVQLAYELYTPSTFTLTPTQLKTLKNQNNIWSNTNGITQVKYWTHGSIADKRKVVWNQIIQDGNFSDEINKWNVSSDTIFTVNNNVARLFYSTVTSKYIDFHQTPDYCISSINGHKYLYFATIQTFSGRTGIFPTGTAAEGQSLYNTYPTKATLKWIWNCSVDKTILQDFRLWTGSGITSELEMTIENVMCIDITRMFGVGNQPTIEEFEALCAKNGIDLTQYQPYNEGTQMYWYF